MIVKTFVGTWNMQGKAPPTESLHDFIPPGKFDIYAIGTQECEQSLQKSLVVPTKAIKWKEKLADTIGDDHYLLKSHTLGSLILVVFVRKSLVPLISETASGDVSCGAGNILNNKGAVAVGFKLANTSFLFINSHLTAHDKNVVQRNADFHRINSELSFSGPIGNKEILTQKYQRVFWLGDLNYRINGMRAVIEQLIEDNHYDILTANDQLSIAKSKGEIFKGFLEGSLNFRPTFKYDSGTDVYDTSEKARVPSWTDRVLFKTCEEIILLKYESIENIRYSDHRPVVGHFEVKCEPLVPDSQNEHVTSKVCSIL